MSVKEKLGLGGAISTLIAGILSLVPVVIVIAAIGDWVGSAGGATVYLLYGVLPGGIALASVIVGALMCKKRTSMALGITAICLSAIMAILLIALNYILMGSFIGVLAIVGLIGFFAAVGVTIAALCVKEQKAVAPGNNTQG